MLASFLASNYAFYAASQGYTQGIVYPNYMSPQFVGYSTMTSKDSTQSSSLLVPSKSPIIGQENNTDTPEKSGHCQKSLKDSSALKFSIARILGETPSSDSKDDVEEDHDDVISDPTSDITEDSLQYSWLHCTRYKPPKLQRKDLFVNSNLFIIIIFHFIFFFKRLKTF